MRPATSGIVTVAIKRRGSFAAGPVWPCTDVRLVATKAATDSQAFIIGLPCRWRSGPRRHSRALTDFVGAADRDLIAFLERAKDLDELVHRRAAFDINPLPAALADAHDECALGRRRDRGGRHKQ